VEKTDSSDEGRSLAASASALTTKLEFEDGALERVHSIHNLAEEPMEFFLASDASAIIEHTKRILFLQDDDVACISVRLCACRHRIACRTTASTIFFFSHSGAPLSYQAGDLSISRGTNRPKLPPTREIKTVELELHAIMKGSFEHFMLKEIYEQPESTFSTMRGRLRMDPEAKVAATHLLLRRASALVSDAVLRGV
jgi:glucosamine 6-phosphate synthetase-like amidotransferase/phosphosugar isomerase protein